MSNNPKNSLKGDEDETMGMWRLVAIVFISTCGGGFSYEGAIQGGNILLAIIVPWITILLWAIPIALTSAELNSAIPRNGGFVMWSQRVY